MRNNNDNIMKQKNKLPVSIMISRCPWPLDPNLNAAPPILLICELKLMIIRDILTIIIDVALTLRVTHLMCADIQ